ncbi:hypothetical protein AAG584_02410 [Vreelandella titanicae]|uniref:hypothetical protein n=1 Tax=Halomonadaceae TaxID=28256 RepID=UPI0004BA07CB|nr:MULTISPECIES: hypothetical protein [unclassified Halomonas]NAO96239.1 hypothetical protein [Halomonas sp. MG34]
MIQLLGTLAVAVIGGLVTLMFLSLLVIPIVYSGVDDILNWLHRLIPNRSETIPVGSD